MTEVAGSSLMVRLPPMKVGILLLSRLVQSGKLSRMWLMEVRGLSEPEDRRFSNC